MPVSIKLAQDIEGMRVAGRLASEVLDHLAPQIRPGITTEAIDQICHDYMVNVQQTIPAPLNYCPRQQLVGCYLLNMEWSNKCHAQN